MRRQISFYSIRVVFGLSVLILAGFQYFNTKNCRPCPETVNKYQSYVENILEMTRLKIKFETENHNFTNSGFNTLEDLLMESGGNPVRTLIISTWRSGSSFLGDLLNAMPANFYHYEPLIKYKTQQIREQPHLNKAIHIIKNLLMCNYSGMEEYFNYGKNDMKYNYFSFNTRLWEICKYQKEFCVDANFSASLCRLFPFQNMKVVRLRLHFTENILNDKNLNVKVVLLIRDPRGVMRSRKKTKLCRSAECTNSKLLCDDMISDYVAARKFLQKYPDRLIVLRYEDLALNLNETTHRLLEFLRLGPNESIDKFLLTHTTFNAGNEYSTFRVSHDIALQWKTKIDFKYVEEIQMVCKEAMDLWGYQLAVNASDMASDDFNPVKPYSMNVQNN